MCLNAGLVIHALQSRGECALLRVTHYGKDNELAAPFTDAVNTFYDAANIPIGSVACVTKRASKYNVLCEGC